MSALAGLISAIFAWKAIKQAASLNRENLKHAQWLPTQSLFHDVAVQPSIRELIEFAEKIKEQAESLHRGLSESGALELSSAQQLAGESADRLAQAARALRTTIVFRLECASAQVEKIAKIEELLRSVEDQIAERMPELTVPGRTPASLIEGARGLIASAAKILVECEVHVGTRKFSPPS
ncbi:MAG: hypothetical protein IBJ03_04525 [Gemmatimonadaceae bacterium]|nr:hypothetical protein [Gemmatimonadaceae bacterium]